jgi:hypothetical protein
MGLLLPAAALAEDNDQGDEGAYAGTYAGSASAEHCDCRHEKNDHRRYTGPVLAADANAVVRLRNTGTHPVQPGVAGRLGYQFWTGGDTMLTPEVMFEWDHFAKNQNAIRILGGLRYSAGKVVRPTVFGHAGWGRLNFGDSTAANVFGDQHAFAVDAGAALDFFIANTVSIGAQGAYNLINSDVPVDFLTFGAHLQFTF